MAEGAVRAEGEFKRGWPVVLAAAIGIGLGLSPLPFYTIGVFVGPMSQPVEAGGLGLSPAQIMLALPVYTIGALVMSPIIGFVADRIGVRRVAIASIVLFSLSLALLGLNTGSLPLYVATWMFMAIAGAGTLPITFTRAVNNWFFERRGVALGIALIATGLYGVLAKLLAQQVSTEFGWRAGYIAVALLPLLISLPVALVAFRDVHDKPAAQALTTRLKPLLMTVALVCGIGLAATAFSFALPAIALVGPRPELMVAVAFGVLSVLPLLALAFGRIAKTAAPPAAVARAASGEAGLTLGQALRQWRFWVLAVAFVPISFALGGPIPNIELLLGSKGFSLSEAVGLAAIVGVAVIAGRLVGGYLIDRFWAPGVAAIFLSAPAIALWFLGSPELSRELAMISIFLIGFGAGVEYDFMAYLVARYFGTRAYGAIYGALYGFFAIGAGFGPPMFAAAVRNGPAAVENLMHVAMAVLIVGSLALLTLGRYRTFGADPGLVPGAVARAETVEHERPA